MEVDAFESDRVIPKSREAGSVRSALPTDTMRHERSSAGALIDRDAVDLGADRDACLITAPAERHNRVGGVGIENGKAAIAGSAVRSHVAAYWVERVATRVLAAEGNGVAGGSELRRRKERNQQAEDGTDCRSGKTGGSESRGVHGTAEAERALVHGVPSLADHIPTNCRVQLVAAKARPKMPPRRG